MTLVDAVDLDERCCDVCGAIIRRRALHAAWHDQQTEQAVATLRVLELVGAQLDEIENNISYTLSRLDNIEEPA